MSDVKENQRIFSPCFVDHRIRFDLLCSEFHSTASSSRPSCTIVWLMTCNAGISSSIKITGARFLQLQNTRSSEKFLSFYKEITDAQRSLFYIILLNDRNNRNRTKSIRRNSIEL